MDAMPVRLGQRFSGYAAQIRHGIERIQGTLPRLAELAIGGTAVGTGVNTEADFGQRMAAALARLTGLPFREAENHFEAQASMDTAVEVSGALNTIATSVMKITDEGRRYLVVVQVRASFWKMLGEQLSLRELQSIILFVGQISAAAHRVSARSLRG